jgi:hypothetical protein
MDSIPNDLGRGNKLVFLKMDAESSGFKQLPWLFAQPDFFTY